MSEKKPREWFIAWPPFIKDPLGQVYNVNRMVTNYAFEDSVHVIEKSAYDELVRALERINAMVGIERRAKADRVIVFEIGEIAREALTKISTSGSEG